MRGHYEGASTKLAHDESACSIAGGGVKPREGLVEKDGIARGGKGSDELHAPALPARELAHGRTRIDAGKNEREHPLEVLLGMTGRREEEDVRKRGSVLEKARVLELR